MSDDSERMNSLASEGLLGMETLPTTFTFEFREMTNSLESTVMEVGFDKVEAEMVLAKRGRSSVAGKSEKFAERRPRELEVSDDVRLRIDF